MKKLKKTLQKKLEDEGIFNKLLWEWLYFIKILLNFLNLLQAKKRINKYLNSNEKIKVQLGCGNNFLKGFLNTDLLGKIPINITKKLPFPNNSVNLFYSNHLIEHIYYKQFKNFLKESYRTLKPNGFNIIATPSIEKIIKSIYLNKDSKNTLLNIHKNQEEIDSAILINQIFRGYMHKFIYDFECVNRLAKNQGFRKALKIPNHLIPDKTIRDYLENQPKNINKEITETYILVK